MPALSSTASNRPDVQKLLRRLYALHEAAEDTGLFLWPDDRDAIGALTYSRTHHRALPPASFEDKTRGEQATLRLTLVQALREILDREAFTAIEDARASGVTWQAIAAVLGVEHPGSAMNYHSRLRVAIERPGEKRTPAGGRKVLAEQQLTQEQERRAAQVAVGRYKRVQTVARALLDHAEDLAVNDDARDWMKGAATILSTETPTASEQQALSAYISLAATEISLHAAVEDIAPARTKEALAALEEARNL